MLLDARSRFSARLGRFGFSVPNLDYFLVPLFALFLLLALFGWMRGGRMFRRK
jgi:hypothetical protein